ncbi:hypothetical protein TTHERM_00418510 (macronuclear) [Tetrahymena thermophila SB210]|uniref:Uncharacterized protein n=1 Tax=Tetrahymena thermophila (strain SB210) TaxID=312017 RepID=Q22NV0_TETTS|nr:hypothetical protein TTHERM_00418510 [Tetrahymena thermophila SB210]EAR87061.2 hypothetical protein TTHERM_00418510 [Tetrahymena thermophila SB210]|eukprot:XP_001007306.2 hypothetical protein TTHERM_00418510 [Tetrahymena thermophila SB210]
MNNQQNLELNFDNQAHFQNRSMNQFQQNDQHIQYEDMVAQKIQELQIIQGQEIKQLKQKLIEKEHIIQDLNDKFNKLEENFNYNLQVIDARDHDISELSAKMIELKQICDQKNFRIEELEKEVQEASRGQDEVKDRMAEKNRLLYDKIEELKQEVKFYKNNYNQELLKHKESANRLSNMEKIMQENEQKVRLELENRIDQIKQQYMTEIQKLESLLEQAKRQKETHTSEIQTQNERLLKQNEELLAERIQLKAQLIEKERAQAQEIYERNARVQEALTLAQHAQQEAQNLKQANSGWDVVMREKLQIAQQEKEDILQMLNQHKQKSKQKIQNIREEGERRFEELIRENSARVKRLQQELRDTQQQNDFLSLSEKNLKEKLQEALSSNRREVEEIEHKNNLYLKNLEEDKRQLRNEIQIKEFQNNQLNEEIQREIKKYAMLEQEFKEQSDQLTQLEKENTMLIEELVLYKKNFPNVNFGQQMQRRSFYPLQQHQSPFKKEYEQAQGQKDESFEKLFSQDMGYVNVGSSLMGNNPHPQQNFNEHIPLPENRSQPFEQFQKIKELEFDIKTYKDLIEDMTKEMERVKQKLEFNNQELRLSKEECIELRNRVSEQKLDIISMREKLQKYELENKELSKDILEKKTYEQIQQTIKLKDEAIETLKQKNNKYQKEINQLRRERESLSEISAQLKSKCIEYEERLEIGQYGDKGVDPQELRAQNQIFIQQLHQMELQLQNCEEELKKWQKIDVEKQQIIEQLKEELIQNNKLFKNKSIPALSVISHYNHMKRQEAAQKQHPQQAFKNIPKYDQFEEIDDVPVKLNKPQNISNNNSLSPQKHNQQIQNTQNEKAFNSQDKILKQAEKQFKKELIELYDHVNPDSNQFIKGKPQMFANY